MSNDKAQNLKECQMSKLKAQKMDVIFGIWILAFGITVFGL
jgi:hypothetical protein